MSLLRGWAEGVDLQGFLERVWVAEGAIMDAKTCALGTELAAGESLLAGTTTVLDMYFHPDATHEAAVGVGLRHVSGPIFFNATGIDGLEWHQRIEFARSWPSKLREIGGPEVPLYFMPHSTYTDSPEHLAEVGSLAKEMGARIHIHVSETEAENQDVANRQGQTPTSLLKQVGVLDVPTVFGHGVHLSDDDVLIASGAGAAVAHCPGSNLKLGSGIADMKRYQRAGMSVGLGTDGCSSSNDLDMWRVLRTAAHLVALTNGPANVDLVSLIRAATIDGARAIGLAHRIGSIEVGKDADLIAIDLSALHLTPVHNVPALLVYAVGRGDISDVFVAGAQVVRSRQLTRIDVADLKVRVARRVEALNRLV
ncbi:5-methylthioadenosine/S-adenosylhomocysteine deaminase [mine drainage metagenome]|uniref:5-methylthioadenosine/S-adenosylhomocysteine deaminase n=1 Tax=mine drainage metagenome TaxID=410659 RepID=A0A1J5QMA2_9ZZZZ